MDEFWRKLMVCLHFAARIPAALLMVAAAASISVIGVLLIFRVTVIAATWLL